MKPREAAPYLVAGAAAAVEAGMVMLATTAYSHRQLSHRAQKLSMPVQVALHGAVIPYNDPKSWASVHVLDHHQVPDADMLPFVQIADYSDWRDANPDAAADHPELPETFDNIDPYAREVTYETARAIGTKARELVQGLYDPRPEYTAEDAATVLDTEEPRYLYANIRDKDLWRQPRVEGEPQTLESYHYRLRDPHSPSLHPDGVKGVRRDNVPLYINADAQHNRDGLTPDFKRTRLEEFLRRHKQKILTAEIIAHVAVPALVTALRGGEHRGRRSIRNGLLGGAVIGATAMTILEGGRIVNAYGHAGSEPEEAIKTGKITPNEDGSVTTNASLWIGYRTLDEGGWQGNHHEHPDWIAFAKKWYQAPVGKAQEWLAKHRLGTRKQQGWPEGNRPDMAHASVLMLQAERVRTMRQAAQDANDGEITAA